VGARARVRQCPRTPVRSASSPIDSNVEVADEARVRSVSVIDFKRTSTAATSAAAAKEQAGLLTDAGFEPLRAEMLDLDPPAACVLGTWHLP